VDLSSIYYFRIKL